MKVQLVCYEDIEKWILGKFAKNLNIELRKLGVDSNIGYSPDLAADINHHIIYLGYNGQKTTTDTLMITHVDQLDKLNVLKDQLNQAQMGICMSNQTVQELATAGIPRSKLCFVDPAQDGIIKPRQTVIGLTTKVHPDGRKRENLVLALVQVIKPSEFRFKIMGEGWDEIVEKMRNLDFEVEHYDAFNYEQYVKLIPTLDYYLYCGNDEGQMGVIDALAAGVPTIITPQGYHLDIDGGIVYPIQSLNDMIRVFEEIAEKKRNLVRSVTDWTWANYAKKHLHIWQYLLTKSASIPAEAGNFRDGLASVDSSENPSPKNLTKSISYKLRLLKDSYMRRYYTHKRKNIPLWKIGLRKIGLLK
jgi:glycosyltransferase involved in cell wall biosynthesis